MELTMGFFKKFLNVLIRLLSLWGLSLTKTGMVTISVAVIGPLKIEMHCLGETYRKSTHGLQEANKDWN